MCYHFIVRVFIPLDQEREIVSTLTLRYRKAAVSKTLTFLYLVYISLLQCSLATSTSDYAVILT